MTLRHLTLLTATLAAACSSADGPVLAAASVRHLILPPCAGKIPAPRAVDIARDGRWLVLDTAGRVLVFDPDGGLREHWFMPEYEVGKPEGILELRDGRIAVADTHYHRIVFFDAQGSVLGTLGEKGTQPGQFGYPVRLTEDDSGHFYVAEYGGNDRVQKFTLAGEPVLAFGRCGTGPGELQRPSGLAWRDGEVLVADAMNNRVHVFRDDGTHLGLLCDGTLPGGMAFPYDVALGEDGRVYFVEYAAGCLTALSAAGALVGRFGKTGSGAGELATPWAVAAGDAGRLLIADTGNRRLVEVRL